MPTAERGILAVVDGSATGDRALDHAIALAIDQAAPLTLLFVIPPRLWRAKRAQFDISPVKHDEAFAHEVLAAGKQRCAAAGVHASTRVRTGAPAEVLVEEVARGFERVVVGERRSPVGAPGLVAILREPIGDRLEVVEE